MRWVTELLFPTMLRWNQWAWTGRQYGSEAGLLVLGNDDDTLPCEGGNVTAPRHCGNKAQTILESGAFRSSSQHGAER